jgi:hypothetical protein
MLVGFAGTAVLAQPPGTLLATALWGNASHPNPMLFQALPLWAVYPLFGSASRCPSGSTTATYTVPPGYLAHHSDEVSASFVATIGAGPGNSSHEASRSLVPGNNGLHLGWALGNHFGWYKGLHGRDESGTVDPGRFMPKVKGHGPSTTSMTPKSKSSHGGPKAGPGVTGTGSSGDPNKGKGMGNGNGHK